MNHSPASTIFPKLSEPQFVSELADANEESRELDKTLPPFSLSSDSSLADGTRHKFSFSASQKNAENSRRDVGAAVTLSSTFNGSNDF